MSSVKCRQCGLVNFAGAAACRRCNTPVSWEAEAAEASVASSQQPGFNYVSAGVNQLPESNAAYPVADSLPMTPAYPSPYEQPAKLRTGNAIASLVLGIFGLLSAGLVGIGSLIGLGLGIRAAIKAKKQPNVYGAKGVAIGGIVLNSLALITIIPIAIIAALVISNVNAARLAANESMAIRHLYQIGTAEATFQATAGRGEKFGDLDELIEEGLLPVDSANKYGYEFKIRIVEREGSGTTFPGFEAVAIPESYGWTGKMSFYTSDVYVVTYADRRGKEATSEDEPVNEYYEELTNPFVRGRSTSGGPAED